MRQDNGNVERILVEQENHRERLGQREIIASGESAKILRAANAVLGKHGIRGVRVYDVKPEFSGFNMHFDGKLPCKTQEELIPEIATRVGIQAKLKFVGFCY